MMRRWLTTIMGTAGLALAFANTAMAAGDCKPALDHPPLVRKGHLIAAINPTVVPIQYVDDDGNIVGLDPELGKAIADRLCLTLDLQSTQFATMIPILKEHRIDMIDSFMFYTPERASQVLMVPYGASTMAIVVPKDNKDEIKGPEYFSGKRFAVELGTVDYQVAKRTSEALQKAGKKPIDIHTFSTYADVLQALSAGQADGAFIGTEEAVWYRDHGMTFFRMALSGYEPHAEALAFSNKEIADAVVKVLNDMKKDGSLDKLFAKYGHCMLPPPFKLTTGPIPRPVCAEIK